jgi:hypothetical protein
MHIALVAGGGVGIALDDLELFKLCDDGAYMILRDLQLTVGFLGTCTNLGRKGAAVEGEASRRAKAVHP